MKFIRVLLLTAFSLSAVMSYAQNAQCDCSAALSNDLTTIHSSEQYQKLREWLYVYFSSDETHQKQMKSDKSFSWNSEMEAVIEEVPVKGKGDANYTTSDQSQIYNHLAQVYSKNNFFSDDDYNEVFTRHMSNNQLEAYKACLETCGTKGMGGLSSIVRGDPYDEFSIQIDFSSTPSGDSLSLSGDAIYNNLTPMGKLLFKDKTKIRDRQSIVQYFKRIDPKKNASFSFNVKQSGVALTPIQFSARRVSDAVNTQQTPVGTIVASVLNYNAFLQANGLPVADANDMSKAIWIPCDGRSLNASTYSKYGIVPDLRGVFLRGINDFGVSYSGVSKVADNKKNPIDKNAGDFQQDALLQHFHSVPGNGQGGPPGWALENVGRIGTYSTSGASEYTNVGESRTSGDETRPKNITVYYYLKIN